MSSAVCFNLDQCKILSSGKGLRCLSIYSTRHTIEPNLCLILPKIISLISKGPAYTMGAGNHQSIFGGVMPLFQLATVTENQETTAVSGGTHMGMLHVVLHLFE